jgi:hypothetical protein
MKKKEKNLRRIFSKVTVYRETVGHCFARKDGCNPDDPHNVSRVQGLEAKRNWLSGKWKLVCHEFNTESYYPYQRKVVGQNLSREEVEGKISEFEQTPQTFKLFDKPLQAWQDEPEDTIEYWQAAASALQPFMNRYRGNLNALDQRLTRL